MVAKREASIDVLMYHSISTEPGPTSISPAVFNAQMAALADHGYQAISLSSLARWYRGEQPLPDKPVVITFDDGFADFAAAAFQPMHSRGFTATVFLPTRCMGGRENWVGANSVPRQLMDWSQVQELAAEGIDFGGHSLTHADLTTLSGEQLRSEVQDCQKELADKLGRVIDTFAPPYGRSNPAVLVEIAKCSSVSVGTELGRATRSSNRIDLPRIEMFYFQDQRIWRSYLARRGDWYLGLRRVARDVRSNVHRLRTRLRG